MQKANRFGPHAKDICHRKLNLLERRRYQPLTQCRVQTIGMAIQRENSICILETVLDSRKLDEVYYLELILQLYNYSDHLFSLHNLNSNFNSILGPDCNCSLISK